MNQRGYTKITKQSILLNHVLQTNTTKPSYYFSQKWCFRSHLLKGWTPVNHYHPLIIITIKCIHWRYYFWEPPVKVLLRTVLSYGIARSDHACIVGCCISSSFLGHHRPFSSKPSSTWPDLWSKDSVTQGDYCR